MIAPPCRRVREGFVNWVPAFGTESLKTVPYLGHPCIAADPMIRLNGSPISYLSCDGPEIRDEALVRIRKDGVRH
jgi:hypothetical protein